MSWYNNTKKLEENVDIFFNSKNKIDFVLLESCLKSYLNAQKLKNKSSILSSNPDSSKSQRIKHELNCEDFEYKRMLLQRCIDELSTSNFGFK